MVNTARRKNREVSSTATRIYQTTEWVLILATLLKLDPSVPPESYGLPYTEAFGDWSQHGSCAWQIVLVVTVAIVVLAYEARSKWMSLLLYVVIFPTSIAHAKCRTKLQPVPSAMTLATSFEVSVVSYLYAFLPFFRPIGDWTPAPEITIQYLGYILPAENSFVATLHLQMIQLGRSLVGSSLNTIELSLLSHSLTMFTTYYLRSIDTGDHPFPEVFFFAFLWGLLLAVIPAIPFLKSNMRLARMKPQFRPKNAMKQRYTLALYAYLTIALVLVTLVRSWILGQLGQDPFIFIFTYLLGSLTRLLLVIYWGVVASSGVIVVIYFWGSKPVGGFSGFPDSALRLLRHSNSEDLHQTFEAGDVFFEEEDTSARRARALDRRRKFFHGLVVVLFLPTMNRDPELSYLALALAFTAFIFEEVVRATVLPPFGLTIHKFLSGFTDHRDKSGHLVVSHLFLLIGVAAPVWLTLTGDMSHDAGDESDRATRGSIAMLSGVLTLGAGDAAASIIGKKFGKHKWPTLQKSMEGTLAFILAMMLGGCVTHAISGEGALIDWTRFTISVIATGVLEAVSTQNDNLVIPMFMWCLIYQRKEILRI